MSAVVNKPLEAIAAFRVPAFRAFWFFRLFVSTAIQIQGVAVGWQIYELTHKPLMLGFIGLAEAVPALGIALYAGHVADIMSRRTILRFATGLFFLASVALAAVSYPGFHDHLVAHIWLIYLIIFATGLCRGFLSPAQFGLLGQIVPTEMYSNASIWNANVWQAACIGGPAIACGMAFATQQSPGTFSVITYAISALMLFAGWVSLLGIPSLKISVPRPDQSIIASIHEGLRFVFRSQVIFGSMALDLFAVLFGGAVALLPIYAGEILHTGPFGLGLLRMAPAVGSAIVGLYLSWRPITRRAGSALLWNVAGFGVSMILFGISRNAYWSFVWLALSGGFDAVSVFVRWTMFQIVTPDHMKGRVASVSSIFVGSSNEIGECESGIVATWMGTVPSVVFGGCMTLVVAAATCWLAPKLRALDMTKVVPEE